MSCRSRPRRPFGESLSTASTDARILRLAGGRGDPRFLFHLVLPCSEISHVPTNGIAGLRPTKWSLAGFLCVIIAANLFTYWFLCKPELEFKANDPGGYSYLQKVLGSAGGILGLSASQRCIVHCIFATILALVICAVATLLSTIWRANLARNSGDVNDHSSPP